MRIFPFILLSLAIQVPLSLTVQAPVLAQNMQGPAADGSAAKGNPVWEGGRDSATGLMHGFKTDSSGELFIANPGSGGGGGATKITDSTGANYLAVNASGFLGLYSLPAIPAGSNVIGAVTQSGAWSVTGTFWPYSLGQTTMSASVPVAIASNQGALAVTGTFYQATQPVSLSSLPALAAGAAAIGTVGVTALPSLPAGTNVIGHVIADSGSTTAVTSLPALPAGTNVIGHTISDSGSTTAVTGNVTVTQGTGSSLHAVIDSGTTTVTQSTGSNLHVQVDSAPTTTVTGTVTANAGTGTFAVSATSLPLPSGAAIAAKQPSLGTAGSSSVDVISVQGIAGGTALPISGSITATNPSVGTTGSATPASATLMGGTDGTNLRGLSVDSSGRPTVNVNGTAAVTGTFWQATQPVSGTFWQSTQPVSGTFWQATQPISVATLPALTAGSAVIGHVIADSGSTTVVTGSVTVSDQTSGNQKSQLVSSGGNSAAVDTAGNVSIVGGTTEQTSLTAGSLNADLVASTDVRAYRWGSIQTTGTWSGTLTIQGSNDNSTFVSITMTPSTSLVGAPVSTTTTNGIWVFPLSYHYLRIRMTVYSSGTANGTLDVYTVPPAANSIGVSASQNGAFTVTQGTSGASAWKVDGSAVTQPVSGTLNVNLNPAATSLNTYSIHLTSNTTTTPTASTAYISSITISSEVGGTTSTVTIQDKQGTPLKLVNGLSTTSLTTTPTTVNFQTPVKMVSGIDIITAGAVAATIDVWVNYYQ